MGNKKSLIGLSNHKIVDTGLVKGDVIYEMGLKIIISVRIFRHAIDFAVKLDIILK